LTGNCQIDVLIAIVCENCAVVIVTADGDAILHPGGILDSSGFD
jgi:hypothetical protein